MLHSGQELYSTKTEVVMAFNTSYYNQCLLTLGKRMRSKGNSSFPRVCLSVCYHYYGATGYEAAKERYQRLERYVAIVFKKAIFLKLLRTTGMAWNTTEKANMLMSTGSSRPVFSRYADCGGIRRYSKVQYRVQCTLKRYRLMQLARGAWRKARASYTASAWSIN